MKKYPLLISLIISCVIVVASLFIMGFFGMNFGTSLAGGSQFEVRIDSKADAKKYIESINTELSSNGLTADTVFVEDKYIAEKEEGQFTNRAIVVKIAEKGISDDKKVEIQKDIAEKLNIDISRVTLMEEVTSSIKTKNILFIGLAIGIVAIILLVLGWVRYSVFAGISFVLAILHNIILYLSVLILSRVQLSLVSLAVALMLTIVMCGLMIQIYEKDREQSKIKDSEKQTISERMFASEKQVASPYAIIGGSLLIFAVLLLIVPVTTVRFISLNIVIALAVTAYTGLLIGPGVYVSLMEMAEMNKKALLSRNDSVNKEIKKKVKKAAKEAKK